MFSLVSGHFGQLLWIFKYRNILVFELTMSLMPPNLVRFEYFSPFPTNIGGFFLNFYTMLMFVPWIFYTNLLISRFAKSFSLEFLSSRQSCPLLCELNHTQLSHFQNSRVLLTVCRAFTLYNPFLSNIGRFYLQYRKKHFFLTKPEQNCCCCSSSTTSPIYSFSSCHLIFNKLSISEALSSLCTWLSDVRGPSN